MLKLIPILLISILLTGCGFEELMPEQEKEVIEKEVIKEVIKEKIVYIDRNITVPCNTTNECPEYEYNYTSSNRELELIRRLRFLESQTDKYFNDSECNWELNKSKIRLEDCEHELCYEWNSSWC